MSEFEKLVSEQMKIMDHFSSRSQNLTSADRWKRNSSVWKEMQSWTMYRTKLRQSEKTWPAYRSYSKGRQSKSSSLIAARKSRLPMCRNECAIPEAEWFFYFHFLIRNVIIVKRLVGKQLRCIDCRALQKVGEKYGISQGRRNHSNSQL